MLLAYTVKALSSLRKAYLILGLLEGGGEERGGLIRGGGGGGFLRKGQTVTKCSIQCAFCLIETVQTTVMLLK